MTESNVEYYPLPVLRTLSQSITQLRSEIGAVCSSADGYLPFLHDSPSELIALLLGNNPLQDLTPSVVISSSEQYFQTYDSDGWQTLTWFFHSYPSLIIETTFHENQLAFALFAFLNEANAMQVSSGQIPLSIQQFINT